VGRVPDERNAGFRRATHMTFKFIADDQGDLPIDRLCEIMEASPRGDRACRTRPLSPGPCRDLAVLAHIRAQFAVSPGRHGRPRMTEELKDAGRDVGHRRVGRLMRDTDLRVERSKTYEATPDSNHSFDVAPNLLDGDVLRQLRTRNGRVTSGPSGRVRDGCTWQ